MWPNQTATPSNVTFTPGQGSCSFLDRHFTVPPYMSNWAIIVVLIVNGISSATAIITNLLVIFAIWNTPSLQTPKDTLLCFLSLSDFFVGLISQPILMANLLFGTAKHYHLSAVCISWFLSESVGALSAGVSFLTLVAMSIDRYICLFHPLRYEAIVTRRRVIQVLMAVWIFTVSSVLLRFCIHEVSYVFHVLVPCSLIANTWIHVKILLLARHHQKAIRNTTIHLHAGQAGKAAVEMSSRAKTAKTVTYIFGLFVVCYAPLFCCIISWHVVGLTEDVRTAMGIAVTIVYINSTLNPALYCWRMRDIRRAIVKLMKKGTSFN